MTEATTEAFEAHRRDVYRWALRIVGRHQDALDVVQDVGLRWLDRTRTGPPLEHPRSWLRTVTVHRAIDLVRARGRTNECPSPEARCPAAGETERGEVRAAVAGALASLTDAQRIVLVAKARDQATFAEIAAGLGVSVPTAKTHYLRAIRAMRDRLERRLGAPEEEP
jgi:RNA polymerase sigma-70 factor (ECF subfamily)